MGAALDEGERKAGDPDGGSTLVTSAARGLGQGIALGLAEAGAGITCLIGVLFGVGSVLAALIGEAPNVSGGALGAGLGILGYFLGARRLATATVVFCVAAIFFALAASLGLIP